MTPWDPRLDLVSRGSEARFSGVSNQPIERSLSTHENWGFFASCKKWGCRETHHLLHCVPKQRDLQLRRFSWNNLTRKNETRPNRRGRQKITPWPAGSWGLWYGRASLFSGFEFQKFLEPFWYVSQFVNDVCRRSCHFLRDDGQILKGLVLTLTKFFCYVWKPFAICYLVKSSFFLWLMFWKFVKFLTKFRQNILHFFCEKWHNSTLFCWIVEILWLLFSEQHIQICKDF